MIGIESRYASNKVARVTEDGVTRTVIEPQTPRTLTFDFTYYQWVDGDRIDRLADSYFGDERLWWVIADANPEILVWRDLEAGTVIRIPDA